MMVATAILVKLANDCRDYDFVLNLAKDGRGRDFEVVLQKGRQDV